MRINLLDSIIVLLSGAALSLFLLWASGELTGIAIFLELPSYLERAGGSVFQVITGGVVLSLLLYSIRRQVHNSQIPAPNYVLYILCVNVAILFLIILLSFFLQLQRQTNIESLQPPTPSPVLPLQSVGISEISDGLMHPDFNAKNDTTVVVKGTFFPAPTPNHF